MKVGHGFAGDAFGGGVKAHVLGCLAVAPVVGVDFEGASGGFNEVGAFRVVRRFDGGFDDVFVLVEEVGFLERGGEVYVLDALDVESGSGFVVAEVSDGEVLRFALDIRLSA